MFELLTEFAPFQPNLSFKKTHQRLRTEHVHGLHPYLGKFIPQIPSYFLKKYFSLGNYVLDPFCGSGTTIVESNIHGINAFGIDISEFNIALSRAKVAKYNVDDLDYHLLKALNQLNNTQPVPPIKNTPYLNKWMHPNALDQLRRYQQISKTTAYEQIMQIILTRSARSARLTTHYDLAHPRKPAKDPYYCLRHKKICHPPNNAFKFLSKYTNDTIVRLGVFNKIRTNAKTKFIQADARRVHLPDNIFDGVITSPPYLGKIDYHLQHIYAYELLGLKSLRSQEIGRSSLGTGKKAKEKFFRDVSLALQNIDHSIKPGGIIVIITKDHIYPKLAANLDYKIIKKMKRDVSSRTQRDGKKFAEDIYIMQK